MHRCPQWSCATISLSVFMGGGVAPSYILHAQSVHARDTSRASASAQTCPEDIGVLELAISVLRIVLPQGRPFGSLPL